ncbi:hypothetical protein J7T55_000030 [Diaporthe amygdali]|uniref:uncharacterized protein n=1 Tax=Phomopsis amygdali TaxID=1214568 RepID=UPI0022FE9B81|nr:uncharacterized protein J7T55_000030 [Diaporthe amygdali]KAJ0107768.1 hypothetical protein J7T55_000030 [Diaporthe amygdali]
MTESLQLDEVPVPKYIETDEREFFARLKAIQNKYPSYPVVPVTKHPSTPNPDPHHNLSSTESWKSAAISDTHNLQADILTALFEDITMRDIAAVQYLIRQGLIAPDCPNATGETPLLAAIRSRSVPMARTLLALGAQPNQFGKVGPDPTLIPPQTGRDRTPLMLAAAMGNLVLVKLLMEEHGTDDALVGPAGEIVLRLAAEGGHRDVVRYLPARRAGAWRRLKHSKEVKRARRAVAAAGRIVGFLGWTLPRFLLWEFPREVAKWAWRHRRLFGELCVRLIKGVPEGLMVIAKATYRLIEGFPTSLMSIFKAVYLQLKGLPRLGWQVVIWISKALPRAWKVVRKWLVDGARAIGGAIAFGAVRLVSLLHSLFAAVISRLKETKLKDLGHDLLVAVDALFNKLPREIWSFVSQLVAVSWRALNAFFWNDCVWLLLEVVCFVPRTFWSMLESLLACVGRGLDELITLLNPKRFPAGTTRS